MLVVLTAAIYFARLTTFTIRGGESEWGGIAYQMLQSGDWTVPRQQGEPYLKRPPLVSWLIAATAAVTGDVDALAIRLPSAVATVFTTGLLYVYARSFLSPLGALGAGAAFATMPHILKLGRQTEVDATFTLLVSGALLLWHLGYTRRWRPIVTWGTGYFLMALGALAKGPQAPAYFAATIGVFLLLDGNWRYAISWAHAGGLLVFALVIGAWQVPFFLRLGWQGVADIWLGNAPCRVFGVATLGCTPINWSLGAAAGHLILYPLEVLGCWLPWSVLLVLFLFPRFWQHLGPARQHVRFLTAGLLVTFPTCWLAPDARPRHFMVMYPLVAPLIGLAIQRCSEPGEPWRWVWDRYTKGLSLIMVAAAVVIVVISLATTPDASVWAQPHTFALSYAILSVMAAGVIRRVFRGSAPSQWRIGILTITAFLGFTYTGVVINQLVNDGVDTEGAVTRLKQQLPAEHRLLSIGPANLLFAYFYRDAIGRLAADDDASGQLDAPGTYFLFERYRDSAPPIRFPWEPVATIPVSDTRRHAADELVIIGRRLPRPPTVHPQTHVATQDG